MGLRRTARRGVRFTQWQASARQAPVNNQVISGTPSFLWSEVPGARRYDLWVRYLTTGADQVIRETNLATPTYKPANSLPPSNYIWWVRAIGDENVTGNWSIGGRFAVAL